MADAQNIPETAEKSEAQLDSGSYEVIKKRLLEKGNDLQAGIHKLNDERKNVFGSIESELIQTERVTTENNCVPRDMVAIGNHMIFGYNIRMGLKKEIQVSDVFSCYSYSDHAFHDEKTLLLDDKRFIEDFKNLYKYYKNATFAKFAEIGNALYLVFQISKKVGDVKAFKFIVEEDSVVYVDNRSDHEYTYPSQYEFEWKRTHRDLHRSGKYPHISVLDKVFVETIGGDLTIKMEDNTESGEGIYAERVSEENQGLDDAEIYYADLNELIILKIRPYQEDDFRYIVVNVKQHKAVRIDSIGESCVLLPEDQGIIFSNGYYLVSGEYKEFEKNEDHYMVYERKIVAPNGEDNLFIFYDRTDGIYKLLSYNIIEKKITDINSSHGFSLFGNGEMIVFRSDEDPQKHHAIQIWKTPFLEQEQKIEGMEDNFLYKIGNKDIVRCMSEMQDIMVYVQKDDVYASLYLDLVKKCTDVLDSYFWVQKDVAFGLGKVITMIKDTANSAVEEFEKVIKVKSHTESETKRVSTKAKKIVREVTLSSFSDIIQYVKALASVRAVRGEIISLKDLKYCDIALIDSLEDEVVKATDKLSENCAKFLLEPEALNVYQSNINEIKEKIEHLEKTIDADDIEEALKEASSELEMLIDIVSNLKIADPNQTTAIIDSISELFTQVNNLNIQIKNKRKSLQKGELAAEYTAQMKLLNQGMVNYIEISDTPEKCDDYLSKLLIQVDELEGKFADFEEYLETLGEKRDEIYNSFEAKKTHLVEENNRKINNLQSASDRILKGIRNKVSGFKENSEINSYFAADVMVDKIRTNVKKLVDLGDSVKADALESQLKSIQEEAIRQLKDKNELFAGGGNLIQFGNHQFSVSNQKVELTTLFRDGDLYFHLSGTNFYEKITDPEFLKTKEVWSFNYPSENDEVYRAEYLAYLKLNAWRAKSKESKTNELDANEEILLNGMQEFMAPRYEEGYAKGVHDIDASAIYQNLIRIENKLEDLRFHPQNRVFAILFWESLNDNLKTSIKSEMESLGLAFTIFNAKVELDHQLQLLQHKLQGFQGESYLFRSVNIQEAAEYLSQLLLFQLDLKVNDKSMRFAKDFKSYIRMHRLEEPWKKATSAFPKSSIKRYEVIYTWYTAYFKEVLDKESHEEIKELIHEIAYLCYRDDLKLFKSVEIDTHFEINKCVGNHNTIHDAALNLEYRQFISKLDQFHISFVPKFNDFVQYKKDLTKQFEADLRLSEFKPRVLSSFVRNKLIDKVYLPMIGENLAKQIGAAGDSKRTDLMGMLLLISPPGYGKTTLMEYIANRLGIIFLKVNGPAIGHEVTSLDPEEAPNASAREEVQKLNLGFEMGDNVMVYLDDIQHLNPEFLQKFISLCDGQRKIEGVFKGKSKTYDLRGRKVAVVMAGNPYTESGDKFQIPDMLANRADTYNLGDILGGNQEYFDLSYIENCLTSNSVFKKLSSRYPADIHGFYRICKSGSAEGVELEGNYSAEEHSDILNVLKKLLRIRDVILKVNKEYIRSASQADEYRTEPPFKLQGSYRNMNKMCEKVLPIMNDEELEQLISDHYEGESQTLTTGAEANMLKFKELIDVLSGEELERWDSIKETYVKNMKMRNSSDNAVAGIVSELSDLNQLIQGFQEAK